jgi:hypothetical protein
MINRGQFRKGETGNMKGRPKSGRALAQVLRETGEYDSYGELSNKQLVARMIWEGLAWGKISCVGGKTINLNGKEWLDLVKWVHSHIDGGYRAEPSPEEDDEQPDKLIILYGQSLAANTADDEPPLQVEESVDLMPGV